MTSSGSTNSFKYHSHHVCAKAMSHRKNDSSGFSSSISILNVSSGNDCYNNILTGFSAMNCLDNMTGNDYNLQSLQSNCYQNQPIMFPPPPQQGSAPVVYNPPPPPVIAPQTGNILADLMNWMSSLMASLQAIMNPPKVAANESGTITGDPHFKGGDGDTYDVQGQAGKTYNLLSDQGIQFNGKFGAWGNNGATVVTETGITVKGSYGNLSAVNFDKNGNAKVNGQELKDGHTVQLADGGTATKKGNKLIVTTAEGYTITQEAMSGGYINTEVKTGANGVGADGVLPGGLLGQTFDPDNIAKKGKTGAGAQGEGVINGNVSDYEMGGLNTLPFDKNPYPYPGPIMPPPPPPPPPVNTGDNQLNAREMYDLVQKVGGSDGKITSAELEAALNDPNSNLTQDQKTLGQQLLKTLKTMDGAGSGVFASDYMLNSMNYDPSAGLTFKDLLEMAEADGKKGVLSLDDTAKNNGTWSSSNTNNDGQLGINELFANDGNGKFSGAGFIGYFSKGDGEVSLSDLKDRLANGAISPDERKIAEALVKYLETKRDAANSEGMTGIHKEPFITAAELKQLMSADSTGSNMSLSVSDIQTATTKIENEHPKLGEHRLTTYMNQNFEQLDKDHDGFLNADEIKLAGQLSGNTNASDTFINNMNLGPYGKGLIFESIDPGAAAWHGVSKADLKEIVAEQKMGKTLKQIAADPF